MRGMLRMFDTWRTFPRRLWRFFTIVCAVGTLVCYESGLARASILMDLDPVADGEYNWRSNGGESTVNGSMRVGIVQVGSQYRVARGVLKFDLSGIDLDSILSASLQFTATSDYGMGGATGPNDPFEVYRSVNDNWAESGTTLSGLPFGGLSLDQLLGTIPMANSPPYPMTITVDLLAGGWDPTLEDDYLSFVIRKTPDYVTTTKRYYNIDTRESLSYPTPKLLIELPDPPAVPEPTTFIIWSVLGVLAMAITWRRKRSAA